MATRQWLISTNGTYDFNNPVDWQFGVIPSLSDVALFNTGAVDTITGNASIAELLITNSAARDHRLVHNLGCPGDRVEPCRRRVLSLSDNPAGRRDHWQSSRLGDGQWRRPFNPGRVCGRQPDGQWSSWAKATMTDLG